jgi:hypothetical protein
MPTQLHKILYTGSKDMLVLPYAVVSCYNSLCTNGSTSPKNYPNIPYKHGTNFHII